MSRVYCDTNVILPLFTEEAQSRRIEAWLVDPELTPLTSDLVVLEFSATIARLVREQRATVDEAIRIGRAFQIWGEQRERPLAITRQMFDIARTIVERSHLGVRGPDALHLALVTATGLPFATFDARLRAAAQTLGLAVVEPPHL